LLGSSALAQTDQNQIRNRFAGELEKTDRVIEQARVAINRSNTAYGSEYLRVANRQAEELLTRAVALQNEAKALFSPNSTLADLAYGGKKSITARELAFKAIAIKKRAEGKVEENENTVLRQLEKTERLIEKLRENTPANAPDRLKSAFDSALENQRRAQELYRGRSLRAALKLSRQAEKAVLKLGEHLRSGNTENRRLQNQIMQTEQKMAQIRLEIRECNSDEALRLLSQADEKLKECYQNLSENKNEKARNILRNTQRLSLKAARLCSDTESLTRAANQLKTEIEKHAEQIISSNNETAIKLFESARRHLRDAIESCGSGEDEGGGENETCAASIKAAQMNLRKALKLTGN
jgi:hypothetical protein